jgi:hypothetical protein
MWLINKQFVYLVTDRRSLLDNSYHVKIIKHFASSDVVNGVLIVLGRRF